MLGMKDCVVALAMKRGISKVEAQSIMNDVVDIISTACVNGGVSFKGNFTIKPKLRKGRSGSMNGTAWSTEDKTTLTISVGSELDAKLNS